jgi:hypothetical protein
MTKYLTTKQTAAIEKISERRVRAKIKQGYHYPHAKLCDCGQAWLIPEKDLKPIKN